MKYALLIIDMINDFNFTDGDMLLAHAKNIIEPILHIKKVMKKQGLPTIYINDHYNLWLAHFGKIINTCRNEENKEFIQKIKPTENDYFLIKPKHSAFYWYGPLYITPAVKSRHINFNWNRRKYMRPVYSK